MHFNGIAKTASRNVAFKSDKLMDALFREGTSKVWPATLRCIFLIRMIVRIVELILATSLFT